MEQKTFTEEDKERTLILWCNLMNAIKNKLTPLCFSKAESILTRHFSYIYTLVPVKVDERIVCAMIDLWNTMNDKH